MPRNAGDLLIRHPFHIAQHQRLAKRHRELIDGPQYLVIHDAVEERALWVLVLQLREDGVRLDLVQVYSLGMPGAAAVFIDEGVPQNGKQPSLGVGSFLVLVPGAIGLKHRLLDQIVGVGGVPAQAEGHPIQHVEVHQRLAFKVARFSSIGGDTSGEGVLAMVVP